jgi:hypothetical protein
MASSPIARPHPPGAPFSKGLFGFCKELAVIITESTLRFERSRNALQVKQGVSNGGSP